MNTTKPRWNRIALYTLVTIGIWFAMGVIAFHHEWTPNDVWFALMCGIAMDDVERRRARRQAARAAA